jgi:hypothetical protein
VTSGFVGAMLSLKRCTSLFPSISSALSCAFSAIFCPMTYQYLVAYLFLLVGYKSSVASKSAIPINVVPKDQLFNKQAW